MKNQSFLLMAAIALVAIMLSVSAVEAAEQTKCPHCGHGVNESSFIDYNGKRIYACSDDCTKEMKADPVKWAAKLEAEGVELKKTPDGKKCPKMSKADHTEKHTSGCCKTREKSGAHSKAYGAVETNVQRSQTTCPVTGEPVNKQFFADVAGKRVYTCCSGCAKKVKADSAKYIDQLKKQGIDLEASPSGD